MKSNTYIKPSNIHGLGLFADRDIKAGEEIIQGVADFQRDIDAWIRYARTCKKRSFTYDRGYCMVNHSLRPNAVRDSELVIFAARDILINEEITEDYYALPDDHNPFLNLLEEVIYRGALAARGKR